MADITVRTLVDDMHAYLYGKVRARGPLGVVALHPEEIEDICEALEFMVQYHEEEGERHAASRVYQLIRLLKTVTPIPPEEEQQEQTEEQEQPAKIIAGPGIVIIGGGV